MGDAAMIREVIYIILSGGGYSMCLQKIMDTYQGRQLLTLDKLQAHPSIFKVSKDGLENKVTIVAPTKICPDYTTPSGCQKSHCSRFHICKFYILSDSCVHQSCNFGHSLKTDHNRHLLSVKYFDHPKITEDQLRMLFRRVKYRTGGSLPVPCNHYVMKNFCRKGNKCNHLHICGYLLMADCKFGTRCSRNHSIFSENVEKVLEKYGINCSLFGESGLIKYLIDIYKINKITLESLKMGGSRETDQNMPTTSSSKQPDKMARAGDICLFYLRDSCRFNERCRNLHVKSTYQWQWIPDTSGRGGDWENLPSTTNLAFERIFCGLKEKVRFTSPTSKVKYDVDLDDLDSNRLNFRRLSTVDLTLKTSLFDQPWATKWIWYWYDDNNTGMEYKQRGRSGNKNTVKLQDVEIAYQDNNNGTYSFTSEVATPGKKGFHSYVIDFDKMEQTNTKYGTKRTIKRRPEFADDKVIQKRKDECEQGRKSEKLNVPSSWCHSPSDDIFSHYQTVELKPTSEEYLSVRDSILDASSVVKDIISIKRIENVELWTAFCAEKETMDRKLKRDVPIKRLYHGTESSITEAICRQGFDCRLSGSRVGHLYGKGGYFGIDCDVSSKYCDNNKLMFIVKALVGDYTLGSLEYPRPPLKNPTDPSSILFDSCVDNMDSPKMFVLFNNRQVYPEYLIQFT